MTLPPRLLLFLALLLSACSGRLSGPATASLTPAAEVILASPTSPPPSLTPSPSRTATVEPSPVPSATPSPTSTHTPTVTPTLTPAGPTLTPTFDFPDVTVLMQANCRYGPGTAYLYSHGLYEGDRGEVHGRNFSGAWLWIKPENLDRHCWVSDAVVELVGDVMTVVVVQPQLPKSTLYGPPENVQAARDGDLVTVTWDRVWMTEDDDRGYLIEATVCQGDARVWMAVRTDDTLYEFTDEENCSGESGGLLYTVEKHGYTAPVQIPWP